MNTGAMTTSQWLAFATSGFRASVVSTASLSSLYIFQLPAITGLLMAGIIAPGAMKLRFGAFRNLAGLGYGSVVFTGTIRRSHSSTKNGELYGLES